MELQTETRRRTRLTPEVRRAQLIACSLAIFAKRGIGRAGHAEIAEIGNVSVATVFNYFNTRTDLVDAVLLEVESFYTQMVEQAYQKGRDIQECIRDHVELFIDAAYKRPDYISIWLEWSSSVREEVWPRYAKLIEKCLETIEPVLQEGIDSGEYTSSLSVQDLARTLNGFGYIAVQMINHTKQTEPVDKQAVVDLVYSYVTAPLQHKA